MVMTEQHIGARQSWGGWTPGSPSWGATGVGVEGGDGEAGEKQGVVAGTWRAKQVFRRDKRMMRMGEEW